MARPEVEPKTELGKRLREVRLALGDPLRDDAARKLGVSKSSIANYERGERVPDASVLETYRRKYGVDINWLLTGDGKMFQRGFNSVSEHFERVRDGELQEVIEYEGRGFLEIPMYSSVTAAAGPGSIPAEYLEMSVVAFDPEYLRDHGANPLHCTVITAKGESMMPSIPDGSLLVVDHSQTSVEHGCIYVFNVSDRLVVKRARWSMDRTLTLISDNPSPDYPDERFNDDSADQLNVVGRVVFHGRRA